MDSTILKVSALAYRYLFTKQYPRASRKMLLSQLFIMLFLLFGETSGYINSIDDIHAAPRGIISRPSTIPSSLTDLLSTLSRLQRRPTCYRTAAASLVHHCKTLSSDIPDPDRIHFAIKLTICELDLIQQTPTICRMERLWKDCVDTLATKDNWWTTFSGNLREVTNVCWIGRQEIEKGRLTGF